MGVKGSLVCVGIGMTLGSHLTPLARSYIVKADLVFAAVSDGIVEMWLGELHREVRSLQPFDQAHSSRADSYAQMVEAMLAEVRTGKRVCGAFYGHPGVFAWVPHRALELAAAEGYETHMEPGISAEDCLYADLRIDPGQFGCQHYEASQFMFYQRRFDPSAYLILWQVAVAGDRSLARLSTSGAYRQVLVDILLRDYPPEHSVVLYSAATLPVLQPRVQRIALKDLPHCAIDLQMTLVVPPAHAMQADRETALRLDALDATEGESVCLR